MKVTWEERDIRAGRRLLAWNASEEWMINYEPGSEKDAGRWGVTSLVDGMMAQQRLTTAELVDFLNESGNLPIELERPWEKL